MGVKMANKGARVFHILALTLLGATVIPLLAFVLIWRFHYSGNSNTALGLAQIRSALDGSTRLLELYGGNGDGNPLPESRMKLLLNGPVVRLRVGPSSPEGASKVLGSVLDVAGLQFNPESITDVSGTICGRLELDGSWSITDQRLVSTGATVWDAMDEAGRRALANQTPYLRVTREASSAIIRLGDTGYVWAITEAADRDTPCFELFHPQLEAVEVTRLVNARGERVGAEIASLHGYLDSDRREEVIRYDYSWKNPDDSRDRRKVVLMRHVEGWHAVLCAGLYEDEYFLPTKAAESLFASLVVIVGGITLLVTLTLTGRINRSLASLCDFARMTATSDGSAHALRRTGLRELDELSETMSDMGTKIRAREDALREELAEKNFLIEEVHHRVKNNLAVLASIINLQQDQAQGDEAISVLAILRARVNSMALVYQQLLATDEYASLPFNDYIEGILTYYQSDHALNSRKMTRTERLEPINLGFDRAVPFGLIVNELVSNAFRHGISAQRMPAISVDLYIDGAAIVFSIEDNGDGMDHGAEEGTGLLLVRALCTQLRGEISIQSPATDRGTVAIVRVPSS
ncbi:MAG TPA: histidine kinase dimerization/phosphoacceptor domain -containing protein [bacterium]|nr:histidine kinase dimerization/phosphoacceptor domain -containing protein [bacterium]